MSREYRPEPNPSEKPVDPEYRTWETVEAFLNENEQSLKNRVTVDTRRFLMHTPIFGLRTLAAYEELTGWLPDDKKTNFAEQESLQDFKNKLTEELTSKDEREFLDALAILSDLRSSGLIEKKEVRVAKPDMDKITEIILGLLGAENPGTGNLALAFRDTAVLIRNGLFDEIRPEKRKVIYSKLRELSGESIARSLSQIKARLLQNVSEDPKDWAQELSPSVPPQALYGLFLLSDIKTIREYAESNTDEHTP